MELKVVPHILLRTGDKVILPNGDGNCATIVDIVEGYLLCEYGPHRFTLPWGFYVKKEGFYEPIS